MNPNSDQTTIEFLFKSGHPLQVKVAGVQGPACTETTKALAKLGEVETTPTTDYYEAPQTVQQSTTVKTEGW
jgi:hypothetical protein